jgi:hypothetical protein
MLRENWVGGAIGIISKYFTCAIRTLGRQTKQAKISLILLNSDTPNNISRTETSILQHVSAQIIRQEKLTWVRIAHML